jgi:hypothetical protein
LIVSLSFTLIGISISIGAWVCSWYIKNYYLKFVTFLLLISILSSGILLKKLLQKLAALPADLEATTGISNTALNISDVTLYEVGLFTSGILWCVVIFVLLLSRLVFPGSRVT